MSFRVLLADSGALATDTEFPDAAAANAFATDYRAKNPGIRVRIARAVSDAWRAREASRLTDGTYAPLPTWWQESEWWRDSVPARDHFTHLASDGKRIAYTESPEKGEDDKQLVVSVTTYLGRYFSSILSGPDIARIAARLGSKEMRLMRSVKPEDFERIYNGNRVCAESSDYPSCMHYDKSKFRTERHPAYAYGAGDLEIAWIEDTTESDWWLLARAVIWPERKRFVRIYGTEEKYKTQLESMLRDAGFERGSNLAGARLLRVEHGGGGFVLMPYIDGNVQSVEDHGDYLEISRHGELDGGTTAGFTAVEGASRCECCGDAMRDDESYTVGNAQWCEGCYSNSAFTCEHCSEGYRDSEARAVIGRRDNESLWCQYCARDSAFECEYSGNYYAERYNSSVEVEARGGTETWHVDAAEENAFLCENTDTWYSSRDYTAITVNTEFGEQTWCEGECEGEYFTCEDCGELFANEMRHDTGRTLFARDVCSDCGAREDDTESDSLPLIPQRGRIEDAQQVDLAI